MKAVKRILVVAAFAAAIPAPLLAQTADVKEGDFYAPARPSYKKRPLRNSRALKTATITPPAKPSSSNRRDKNSIKPAKATTTPRIPASRTTALRCRSPQGSLEGSDFRLASAERSAKHVAFWQRDTNRQHTIAVDLLPQRQAAQLGRL